MSPIGRNSFRKLLRGVENWYYVVTLGEHVWKSVCAKAFKTKVFFIVRRRDRWNHEMPRTADRTPNGQIYTCISSGCYFHLKSDTNALMFLGDYSFGQAGSIPMFLEVKRKVYLRATCGATDDLCITFCVASTPAKAKLEWEKKYSYGMV